MKSLFDELQNISNHKSIFEQMINELKEHSMRGCTTITVDHNCCIGVFRTLGYNVTLMGSGFAISCDRGDVDPPETNVNYSGYLPKDMIDLCNKYSKTREFMKAFEEEAKVAAAFGRRMYDKPLPDDIDRKLMQEYLDKVYEDVDISSADPAVVFIDW